MTEYSRHNPEHVKLKKVPTTRESNGYYDVPSGATSVVKVLVHNTDIEIEFSTEKIHNTCESDSVGCDRPSVNLSHRGAS